MAWYRFLTMMNKGKVFMNGRSQAVRIPAAYRFRSEEVRIRRDERTGDLILSEGPGSWSEVFAALDAVEFPEDFLTAPDRGQEAPQTRNLF